LAAQELPYTLVLDENISIKFNKIGDEIIITPINTKIVGKNPRFLPNEVIIDQEKLVEIVKLANERGKTARQIANLKESIEESKRQLKEAKKNNFGWDLEYRQAALRFRNKPDIFTLVKIFIIGVLICILELVGIKR
jgi:hypothetical protein